MISIDLNSSILMSILIMRALIIVNFIALQRNSDIKSDIFSSEVEIAKKIKHRKQTNTLPVHERLALDDLTIAESMLAVD